MALTIALNRGRVLEQTLPLLERAGFEIPEDIHSSRKLIFDAGELRLVVMRGSDVPTYVEYGAADVGITGKDTLLEHGEVEGAVGYYERLDLGVARCRIMTAAPVGAKPVVGRVRVATKFVNIAREYFQERGQQVAIIALSGAMEIAPLPSMNLADMIVDIVDTGTTLKANGLEPLELISEVSTRLIVNRASMKTRFDEVQALVDRLRSAIEAGG
jgi:ATP phosphoribosyltransferase